MNMMSINAYIEAIKTLFSRSILMIELLKQQDVSIIEKLHEQKYQEVFPHLL